MRYGFLFALAIALIGTVPPAAASCQILPGSDPGRSVRTRADLERLLAEYEEALESPAYSESVKRTVRADAQRVRTRLRDGDFRIGDRIALYVQGEPELPDTVAVETGPMIALPLFGEISLRGVLRSEISEHLTRELGRFINDPMVRAQGLMRVSIQGQVANPGFYVVPADMLLGEALMLAGGPGPQADLNGLTIERGATRLVGGEELQEAVREGLTLDQLNLQAGDEIVLPQGGGGFWTRVGAVAGVLGTLGFLAIQIF